ncbi:hypothetical protein ACVWW9_000379 [Agrococcus sp. UYP33]
MSNQERRVTFISHASEDKGVVKNLADTLMRYRVAAWYDDYEIQAGDSIRAKINEGLGQSEYGIVVLSHNFFAKKWPKRELAALSMLLDDGRVIPLFHQISPAEVAVYDPLLADVKGLEVKGDIRNVVVPIAKKVLGAQVEEDGYVVYRGQAVRLPELPLDETQALSHMKFEDCVVQGICILNIDPERKITFSECIFNGPEAFIELDSPYVIVGALGLNDVHFVRCRFKEVGFVSDRRTLERLFANTSSMAPGAQLPPHLR